MKLLTWLHSLITTVQILSRNILTCARHSSLDRFGFIFIQWVEVGINQPSLCCWEKNVPFYIFLVINHRFYKLDPVHFIVMSCRLNIGINIGVDSPNEIFYVVAFCCQIVILVDTFWWTAVLHLLWMLSMCILQSECMESDGLHRKNLMCGSMILSDWHIVVACNIPLGFHDFIVLCN